MTPSRTPTLLAGVGRVDLTPSPGVPMMGYAARQGAAESTHDPLFARALYLEREDDATLLVELDLCLIAVAQAAEVRERIAARAGVPAEAVLVGCTHTHSGPDTGVAAVVYGQTVPEHVAPLFDAAVEAAAIARESAEPARLGAGRATAEIGRIRSQSGGEFEPRITVLRVDRADRSPLAVAYLHGCHPTVLGHDSLRYSADWPGAANRAIEAGLPGATAIFVLGAHGDVDPRTRGVQDLAVADRSRGVSPEEMEALGRELGEAVAECAKAIETEPDVPIGARSARVRLAVHGGEAGAEARDVALAERRAAALAALDLPADSEATSRDLYGLAGERTQGLPRDVAREKIARVRLYQRDLEVTLIAAGLHTEVEVQLLRLGPAQWLGLPLEACTGVAREWRQRRGRPHADVVSIANGWLRYLPTEGRFREPESHHRYEVLQSTFAPKASSTLLDLGERLAAELDER